MVPWSHLINSYLYTNNIRLEIVKITILGQFEPLLSILGVLLSMLGVLQSILGVLWGILGVLWCTLEVFWSNPKKLLVYQQFQFA